MTIEPGVMITSDNHVWARLEIKNGRVLGFINNAHHELWQAVGICVSAIGIPNGVCYAIYSDGSVGWNWDDLVIVLDQRRCQVPVDLSQVASRSSIVATVLLPTSSMT